MEVIIDGKRYVPADEPDMRRKSIALLVNKFLAWPVPESVCSDPCATIHGYKGRSGTNFFSADEARQMFEYLLTKE